jgi:hypothetical protein
LGLVHFGISARAATLRDTSPARNAELSALRRGRPEPVRGRGAEGSRYRLSVRLCLRDHMLRPEVDQPQMTEVGTSMVAGQARMSSGVGTVRIRQG